MEELPIDLQPQGSLWCSTAECDQAPQYHLRAGRGVRCGNEAKRLRRNLTGVTGSRRLRPVQPPFGFRGPVNVPGSVCDQLTHATLQSYLEL